MLLFDGPEELSAHEHPWMYYALFLAAFHRLVYLFRKLHDTLRDFQSRLGRNVPNTIGSIFVQWRRRGLVSAEPPNSIESGRFKRFSGMNHSGGLH